LGGQGFVMSNNEGRALGLLDDVSHRKGFTGSCCAAQGLKAFAGFQPFYKLADGFWLVTHWLKVGYHFEFGHNYSSKNVSSNFSTIWEKESGIDAYGRD
jgi:hypothetical protein